MSELETKTYKCKFCNFSTEYKSLLRQHIEQKLESTKKINNILKDSVNYLEQEIESNKNKRINDNKVMLKNYSLSLVDRDKIIKDNKLKKSEYIYKLEYHILKNTIFEEDNIDSENKEIYFLLLDIANKDKLEEIIKKVKNENRKDLIELMIEYGGKLKNRVNFEKKLYGKNIKEYEIIYNKLIENIS